LFRAETFRLQLEGGGAPLNTFQIRVEGMEANNHRLMIRVDQVQPSVESLGNDSAHQQLLRWYGQVAGGIFNLTTNQDEYTVEACSNTT
jgi:hypothetical protein